MDQIIYDIYLARGILSTSDSLHKRQQRDSLDIYTPILEKHGITRDQYDSAMHYYSRYPLAFNDMLDRVLAKIMIDKENIQDSLRLIEQQKMDPGDQEFGSIPPAEAK